MGGRAARAIQKASNRCPHLAGSLATTDYVPAERRELPEHSPIEDPVYVFASC
jgi:hypothetical protein